MSAETPTPGEWKVGNTIDAEADCPCGPCSRGRAALAELAAATGVPSEGPWVAEDDWSLTIESPHGRIANMYPLFGGFAAHPHRNPMADARLMAEAPETKKQRDALLAALRDLLHMVNLACESRTLMMTHDARNFARAAIAKAEGRTP